MKLIKIMSLIKTSHVAEERKCKYSCFRRCWSLIHLPGSPTGPVVTLTFTWPLVTWSEDPSCCVKHLWGTRWTTCWHPTSVSCWPTWTNKRLSEWNNKCIYLIKQLLQFVHCPNTVVDKIKSTSSFIYIYFLE